MTKTPLYIFNLSYVSKYIIKNELPYIKLNNYITINENYDGVTHLA